MPFVKGNTTGAETRFKTGQSGYPAGRPPAPMNTRMICSFPIRTFPQLLGFRVMIRRGWSDAPGIVVWTSP